MELSESKTQKIVEGYGAAYHRLYSVVLPLTLDQAKKAMKHLQQDLNKFSPQLLARFEKVRGNPAVLAADDEYQIHITGPWNGPVRVAKVAPDEFQLVTLEGHLEAGEIRFRVYKGDDAKTLFEIESMARSRDAVVDFVYDKIPIAKLAQTEMWTMFCKNFAEHACELSEADKKSVGEVEIITERQDEDTKQWQKL